MSPNIINVKILDEHRLILDFSNGEKRIFDIKPYVDKGRIFSSLKNMDELKDYSLEDGTIEWNCGACLSQDTFYLESVPYDETALSM